MESVISVSKESSSPHGRNNTCYAVLLCTHGEKRWVIDARPSDAMKLAVRLHCKIYAYREVIEQAGQQIED